MIKRTTFLARREDLSSYEFRRHWEHGHGPIAARFAHLAGYTQNHVLRMLDDAAPRHFFDGIVELWFEDAAGDAAGRDADVSAALVADEPTFLRGLTGARVSPSDIPAPSTFKVWIAGRARDGSSADDVAAFMTRARTETGARHAYAQNALEGTSFTRDMLAVDPTPPHASVVLCSGDEEPTAQVCATILRILEGPDCPLVDIDVGVVREVRIVDAQSSREETP